MVTHPVIDERFFLIFIIIIVLTVLFLFVFFVVELYLYSIIEEHAECLCNICVNKSH